jgi:hypothetical protein
MTGAASPGAIATVLVLARDALGAALLGALVEVSGRVALFPLDGEGAEWAVSRLRPQAVVLDVHHGAARSEGFWTAAADAGSRVIVFSRTPAWDGAAALAERRGAVWVCPDSDESLADRLAAALAE